MAVAYNAAVHMHCCCSMQRLRPRLATTQHSFALHKLGRRSPSFAHHSRLAALPPAMEVQGAAFDHLDSAASQALAQLYVLADAAAAAEPSASTVFQKGGGWLQPLADGLEVVLQYIQTGLDQLHVPYSYGYAIIILTFLVKVATFPLTKIQVESALAIQSVKPTIDALKKRYGDDKERIQKETTLLYEKAKINPSAGCLPSLATIPVFIGLYNSLTNVAGEGLLDKEGFYWIPTLAGPTTMMARRAGSGMAWLYPFVDGQPPIGWEEASKYLVLPILLVIAQFVSSAIISPPIDPNDQNAKTQKAIFAFLPLMIGYFSLNVPAGLSLYYLSNSVLTTMQQVWLRKLGGAQQLGFTMPIGPGEARRTGVLASPDDLYKYGYIAPMVAAAATEAPELALEGNVSQGGAENGAGSLPADPVDRPLNRRSKRLRRALLESKTA